LTTVCYSDSNGTMDTLGGDEKKSDNHKLVVICLHDRTVITLGYQWILGNEHRKRKLNIDRIIGMVCSHWSYWVGRMITRKSIKRIYVATEEQTSFSRNNNNNGKVFSEIVRREEGVIN